MIISSLKLKIVPDCGIKMVIVLEFFRPLNCFPVMLYSHYPRDDYEPFITRGEGSEAAVTATTQRLTYSEKIFKNFQLM